MHTQRDGRYFPGLADLDQATWGMFVLVTLPDGCSSQEGFEAPLWVHVAVLPGTPFYFEGSLVNPIRLNFSNSTGEKIVAGIGRLALVKKTCAAVKSHF
ncbi:MAG: hypothetical protein WCF90_10115 [Methanomicrobiales archaeon]